MFVKRRAKGSAPKAAFWSVVVGLSIEVRTHVPRLPTSPSNPRPCSSAAAAVAAARLTAKLSVLQANCKPFGASEERG